MQGTAPKRLPDPGTAVRFQDWEASTYSQNGEDGILEEIFARIGTTNKVFVEFGAESGQQNNTRHLMENRGWQGLWIEADEAAAEEACRIAAPYPVRVAHRFLTAENINEVLCEHDIPKEFDLLSIDVDGNDYWMWQAIEGYRPRVVVIEFNTIYDGSSWVMPYNPKHYWDKSHYAIGASAEALCVLGWKKGYSFLSRDSQNVNAFFVRSELFPAAASGHTSPYVGSDQVSARANGRHGAG